jgi:hypothetical protein
MSGFLLDTNVLSEFNRVAGAGYLHQINHYTASDHCCRALKA